MFNVRRLVSPAWFLAISGVWIVVILTMGVIVSASEARPSYFDVMDACYVLSLLGAVFSVIAHRHFEMSMMMGAIVFNVSSLISVAGGVRVVIAEMKDCRTLYKDDLAYGQLTAAQMSQYSTGSSTLSVAALGRIIANHNIVTYGVQCLGIELTSDLEYYGHYAVLVICCVVTCLSSVILSVMLLMHIPQVREHAEKLLAMTAHLASITFHKSEELVAEARDVLTKAHGHHTHKGIK